MYIFIFFQNKYILFSVNLLLRNDNIEHEIWPYSTYVWNLEVSRIPVVIQTYIFIFLILFLNFNGMYINIILNNYILNNYFYLYYQKDI